jgi:hypothetical protein
MKTDTEIKIEGTNALIDALGEIQAERYITLITREKFDYTKWQRDLWIDRSIRSISKSAMECRKKRGK